MTGGFATVAGGVMGALARRGWDQSVMKMALAMLIGNIVIYAFGLPWMAWLFLETKGAAWVIQWGLTNFVVFDLLKLALAALMFPTLWRMVGKARV